MAFGILLMSQTSIDTCVDQIFDLVDNLQLSANDLLEVLRDFLAYQEDQYAYDPKFRLTQPRMPPRQRRPLTAIRLTTIEIFRRSNMGVRLRDTLDNLTSDLVKLAFLTEYAAHPADFDEEIKGRPSTSQELSEDWT